VSPSNSLLNRKAIIRSSCKCPIIISKLVRVRSMAGGTEQMGPGSPDASSSILGVTHKSTRCSVFYNRRCNQTAEENAFGRSSCRNFECKHVSLKGGRLPPRCAVCSWSRVFHFFPTAPERLRIPDVRVWHVATPSERSIASTALVRLLFGDFRFRLRSRCWHLNSNVVMKCVGTKCNVEFAHYHAGLALSALLDFPTTKRRIYD